jgi:CP family cyanate transporter-like MFS transporter
VSSPPLRPHSSALRPTTAILAVVVLVALNLRIALSSLPAVATEIQAETGWSAAVIGALTTVPVLTMGLFALVVPRMTSHLGRRAVVRIALILMIIGLGMRALGAITLTLFVSALLAGTAIAILGGLVPGIVREQLSHSMGTATALWTASMMGGAAIGAALTVPLAQLLGGWNLALAFWAIPAAIALIAWTGIERGHPSQDRPEVPVRMKDLPWKDPTAWSLTAFLTLNSVVFISALAWIAPSYQERGYSLETAGFFFGIFTVGQVVGALVLPRWSHRTRYRRSLFVATLFGCAGALVLIAFVPHFAPPIVLAIFSFNLSGGFAMGLGLLSEYASDAAGSARLTAMGFAVTYSVAALGPFAAGAIMDTVGSWSLVFSLLAVLTLVQAATIPLLKRHSYVH